MDILFPLLCLLIKSHSVDILFPLLCLLIKSHSVVIPVQYCSINSEEPLCGYIVQ